MIRQISPAGPDRHVIDTVSPQHRFRRLRTGDAAAIGLLAVAAETSADLKLGPQRQRQNGNQQQDIDIVGKKVTVAVRRIIVRHTRSPLIG